jgi:hypothetical protein
VTESLIELSARLRQTADLLRAGELEPDATLTAIEECARLASEASAQVDQWLEQRSSRCLTCRGSSRCRPPRPS